MIRTYCDRCGKVINVVPTLVEQQTNYVGDEIDFVILRIPKIFGNPSESVDLCADCKLKLKRMITDFLEELKDIIADKIDNASGEQYEYAQIDCPMNQKECDESCEYYNKLLLKCPMKVKGNGGEQE